MRRLLLTLPTLLLVALAVFVLMRVIPGDPVLLMLFTKMSVPPCVVTYKVSFPGAISAVPEKVPVL